MTTQRGVAVAVPTAFCVIASLPIFFTAAEAVRLQSALGFGRPLLGAAIGLAFASSALAVIPFGRLVALIGAGAGLQGSAALTALALLTIAAAGSWWTVAAGLVLGGAANAGAQISANVALAGRVTAGLQGVAFATKQAAGPLATAFAGACVAVTAPVMSWRVLLLGVAVAAVLAARVLPGPSPATPTVADDAAAPRRRGVLLISAVGLLGGIAGGCLATFTVDAAVTGGIGQSAAATLLAAGSIASIAGGLVAGRRADRRHGDGLTELATLTGLGALSFVAISVSGGHGAWFAIAVLCAFATGWGWPGIIYYATVRTQRSGRATGVVLAGVYAGNVIGPVGGGVLSAHISYPATWRTAALCLALASVAALAARRA